MKWSGKTYLLSIYSSQRWFGSDFIRWDIQRPSPMCPDNLCWWRDSAKNFSTMNLPVMNMFTNIKDGSLLLLPYSVHTVMNKYISLKIHIQKPDNIVRPHGDQCNPSFRLLRLPHIHYLNPNCYQLHQTDRSSMPTGCLSFSHFQCPSQHRSYKWCGVAMMCNPKHNRVLNM